MIYLYATLTQNALYKCFFRLTSHTLIIIFIIFLLDICPSTCKSPTLTLAIQSQISGSISILAPASDKVIIADRDELSVMRPAQASHLSVVASDQRGAIRRSQQPILNLGSSATPGLP